MQRAISALAALAATLAVGVAAAVGATAFPATIGLPRGFQPEGISIRGQTFYVGSIGTGSIYRGNLRTGTGSVLVNTTGRAAIGTAVDNRSRLFVAGGPTGKLFVYNARTGAEIATYTIASAPTFINDVVVTRTGAYFTDSQKAVLYRIPIERRGRLGATAQTIPLTGAFQLQPGFNANGIDATPNGRWLVIVQSNTGKLFRVDAATGATTEIAVGGVDLRNGDGILLDGRRLYVVRNQNNEIVVLRLNSALTSGTLITNVRDDRFRVPTTLDELGRRLYVVNAKFGSPPATTDYEIVQVRKPTGG